MRAIKKALLSKKLANIPRNHLKIVDQSMTTQL